MTPEQRIQARENDLNTALAALKDFEVVLKTLDSAQDSVKRLQDYYSSQEWFEDLDRDDAGEFDDSLNRGVLSEDGIFNLFVQNQEVAIQMLELATKMLKN